MSPPPESLARIPVAGRFRGARVSEQRGAVSAGRLPQSAAGDCLPPAASPLAPGVDSWAGTSISEPPVPFSVTEHKGQFTD